MSESILAEAERLTSHDRNSDYGHPLDDFSKTALLWTARLRARGYLRDGVELEPEDVGWLMTDVKYSRWCQSPWKRDHMVDAAGYVRTVWMIGVERARRIGGGS